MRDHHVDHQHNLAIVAGMVKDHTPADVKYGECQSGEGRAEEEEMRIAIDAHRSRAGGVGENVDNREGTADQAET